MRIRVLGPGDEPALSSFLEAHADHTMFLRSNLADGGIVDRGEPLQGTYVAAFSSGRVVAAAALYWNGNLIVHAPEALIEVVRLAAAAAPRPVAGLGGEWDQLVRARAALDLDGRPTRMSSRDDLFTLELEALRVPPALAEGRITVRRAEESDLPLLAVWRRTYGIELNGDDPATAGDRSAEVRAQRERRRLWIAHAGGAPAAMTMFNAQVPGAVQVGGVYCPAALRGRGHARAAVAASLLDARAEGARRAILFTGVDNEPARRAYLSLGFAIVGAYGLILFA